MSLFHHETSKDWETETMQKIEFHFLGVENENCIDVDNTVISIVKFFSIINR